MTKVSIKLEAGGRTRRFVVRGTGGRFSIDVEGLVKASLEGLHGLEGFPIKAFVTAHKGDFVTSRRLTVQDDIPFSAWEVARTAREAGERIRLWEVLK